MLEVGFAVARRDGSDRTAPAPPRVLHPFLRFDRVNARVLRAVLEALESDEGFRDRVAAAGPMSEPSVGAPAADAAAWLFLERPDGWEQELDALLSAGAEIDQADAASVDAHRAVERLAQVEAALAEARDEAADLDARLSESTAELDGERNRRREAESQLDAERRRADAAEEDRARAVKDLGDARRLADRRLEALRAAESQGDAGDGAAPVDLAAAARAAAAEDEAAAVREVALDALRAVARAVGDLSSAVAGSLGTAFGELEGRPADEGPDDEPDGGVVPDGDSSLRPVGATPRPSRTRRVPVRLQRGAVEGTREGTMQLLGLDDVVVLVDGWNVTMTGWRQLTKAEQRDTLVTQLGDLAARTGAGFRVVFDGADEGGRPAVAVPLPVRLYFTAASEEADDAILRMAAEVPLEQPVVVVSSDERVRTGARARGANVVSSQDLLDALRH